jgi:hypothetical protein
MVVRYVHSSKKEKRNTRGQVRLILWNTEGLYTTALQLLTNTMSHVC